MNDPGSPAEKKIELRPDARIESLVHEGTPEELAAVAADGRLTEDLALALLNRRDLPRDAVEALSKNGALAQQPKVRLALVTHPHTPRHISIPVIRHLYAFELMQVALLPSVAADVKRAAEEVLIGRLGTITSGERHTLAKRASGRVAAALLTDKEERVMQAALLNPQMTELFIVRALKNDAGTELLAPAVANHQKWIHRTEIKSALLCNRNTPAGKLAQIAGELTPHVLKSLMHEGRLPARAKQAVQDVLAKKSK
ncbi:MAG TPA: hypothetical protein VJN64_06505 [Terriglobales bacterium]|nr:hypothetical protein [Terriglobales bacterium]